MTDLKGLKQDIEQVRRGRKRGACYPKEVKQRVVGALADGIKLTDLAQCLGIAASSISKWRKDLGTPAGETDKGNRSLEPLSAPPFTFAPVLPPDPDRQGFENVDKELRVEVNEPCGKRVQVHLPWDEDVSRTALAFLRNALGGGAV